MRVLIVGQDPYPTPGHPIGLSFAVERSVRPIPRSLQNIYRELQDDLGLPPAPHGDLTGWAEHGVMLLNRVLTVKAGSAGSHRGKGWEAITEQAIRRSPRGAGLRQGRARSGRRRSSRSSGGGMPARSARCSATSPAIRSPHPSPLSASSGFFGSKPFSRANELLVAQGGEPVDWRLAP